MTETRTGDVEPRTEAGRRLNQLLWDDGVDRKPAERSSMNFERAADHILAIEEEARRLALAEVEARVRAIAGLEDGYHPFLRSGFEDGRAAVLAAIEEARKP